MLKIPIFTIVSGAVIATLLILTKPKTLPPLGQAMPNKYIDKHGQIYSLQRCKCLDGIPPNGCGWISVKGEYNQPPEGKDFYRSMQAEPRIDTVWIEVIYPSEYYRCEENSFWQFVKE